MRIAVLVSGGGTNLQAILDGIRDGSIRNAEVAAVISNNHGAYALERAKNAGVPGECVSPADFADRESFYDALMERLAYYQADLIVLAGYLSLMGPKVVSKYSNRIINIHPALIPSFCGAGMYGIRPHKAALAKGVKVSGATVHFVNENYDEGPILLQKAVDVLPDDTPETLQKRIMQECEWKILPQAIRLIADGKVIIENNICYVR